MRLLKRAETRRDVVLSAAAALFGIAIAIALIPLLSGPARPGQLASRATAIDLDASAPMRFILALIVLPPLVSFAARPVIRRLASNSSQAWARNGAGWSCVVALWLALLTHSVLWTLIPCLVAVIACYVLRNYEALFTRRDMILLPSILALWLAGIDALGGLSFERVFVIAALLISSVRLAVVRIPSNVAPAFSFLFVPLAFLLETNAFNARQRYLGWPVIAVAVLAPFVTRLLLRNEKRAIAIVTFVVYPIAAYGYMNATSITTAEGKPRVIFFEDAHHLVPASEMLRGERPYRDIVPTHGFVEDAALTWTALKTFGITIGAALRTREAIGALTSIGIYALTTAATGVPEAGFVAFIITAMLGALSATIRVVPALFALAAMAASLRTRNSRAMGVAGFMTGVALITSLDFGFYTLVTLIVAVVRSRPDRTAALRHASYGALLIGVPFTIALAAFGVLGDFVRVPLFDLPAAATTGTLTVFTPPEGFRTFSQIPEALAAIFTKPAVIYISWILAAIIAAVLLTRPNRRRTDPLLIISFWMVIAAVSYAQRHHLFFDYVTGALFITVAWIAIRASRVLTPVITIVLMMMAQPTIHFAIAAGVRRSRGPMDLGWTEIDRLPRARGALFTTRDADVVRDAARYVEERLPGDNTFFDFTDRGSLYFLLRRDCPVRQVVVAFYETDELQRQVIARIEANPNVRAALVPAPGSNQIDGVPNQLRAPLVWKYVTEHFEPDFASGDVVFWRRR